MDNAIELTEMNRCYNGGFCRLEVIDWSPHIHDHPGIYLQHVEGCGYTVFDLTPEQAVQLGKLLIAKANKTEKEFKKAKNGHVKSNA